MTALSAREVSVLRAFLEVDGPVRLVAARLGLAYKTVDAHLFTIRRKLDCHTTHHAIFRAQELGLIAMHHDHTWQHFRKCSICGAKEAHEND